MSDLCFENFSISLACLLVYLIMTFEKQKIFPWWSPLYRHFCVCIYFCLESNCLNLLAILFSSKILIVLSLKFWSVIKFIKPEVQFIDFLLIDLREKRVERERERNTGLLFHLLLHLLVATYMCLDWTSNLEPWHFRTML